jgi:hypothetical protein
MTEINDMSFGGRENTLQRIAFLPFNPIFES